MMKLVAGSIILCLLSATTAQADRISHEAKRFDDAYVDIRPQTAVSSFLVPFEASARSQLSAVRVVSVFGSKRLSYLRNHIHSGTDLIPAKRRAKHINVLPIAAGVVCSMHLADPHTTIVIRHRLPDGTQLFSSYKHLAQTWVTLGQEVDTNTLLGRLYTRKEARELGGNYNHLHLEIRKKFDDRGVASWLTMTADTLHQRFYDPYRFLKQHLGKIFNKHNPKPQKPNSNQQGAP